MNTYKSININDIPKPDEIINDPNRMMSRYYSRILIRLKDTEEDSKKIIDHIKSLGYQWYLDIDKDGIYGADKIIGLFDDGDVSSSNISAYDEYVIYDVVFGELTNAMTTKNNDLCPKCGSEMEWCRLAMKCTNHKCWYVM